MTMNFVPALGLALLGFATVTHGATVPGSVFLRHHGAGHRGELLSHGQRRRALAGVCAAHRGEPSGGAAENNVVITGTGGVITRFYSIENNPQRYFRARRN